MVFPSYGCLGKAYICPKCEKEFFVPLQTRGGGHTQWVYSRWMNRKKIYYCSYSCYKKGE